MPPSRRGVGRAPRPGAAPMGSPPAKIRAIREIRGKNRGMKHERLTGEILGAAMAVLDFKEARLAWKRVAPGPTEPGTGS